MQTLSGDLELSLPGLYAARRRDLVGGYTYVAIAAVGMVVIVARVLWTAGLTPFTDRRIFAWILGGFAVVVALLSVGLPWFLGQPLRRAMALSAESVPVLAIGRPGVRIPVLLLTDPAFHLAVERQMRELAIPWSDITGWWVEPGRGKVRPQHLLLVRGESARFGVGYLGSLGSLSGGPQIGFLREYLREHETEIREHAQQFLGEPMQVHDRAAAC